MSHVYEWRDGTVIPDPFTGLEIPDALHASLHRHRENLARLVRSLQSAGVSEEQIETSVTVVVESYRDELLRAIKTIMRQA
ncbi:hypothetical protein SAMN05421770_107248 [Granulicella rosea]|uniref:Uncharacterized protein n=1 Tax=Granulicella rosea TaxID=474952 RepID=A0A239LSN6_9BACT|nr:hypothetical protein [Granulicella rosea]SNT33280.1 hypothetical protein SAMN05421770_107248 [Granulicella rosea]